MKFNITGNPFPVLVCSMEPGESVVNQKGAMCWMSPNMKMTTNAGGSFGKMLSRAVSRESIFQNIYTSEGGPGMIAFSSSVPGIIMPIMISPGKSIVAQKGAFLASEPSVNFEIFFQKKLGAGFFGGEGFIMQRYTGSGNVFIEVDGSVVEYELAAGQSMLIDTGYLVAMDDTVSIEIESVKGVGNVLFGGEGFFNTRVTGPGHIWLQTMPINQLGSALNPYVVTAK